METEAAEPLFGAKTKVSKATVYHTKLSAGLCGSICLEHRGTEKTFPTRFAHCHLSGQIHREEELSPVPPKRDLFNQTRRQSLPSAEEPWSCGSAPGRVAGDL